MKRTILVQGAGGGGGNNLIRSLRQSKLDLRILGSNCLPHAVAKSSADNTYLLPSSKEDSYLDALNRLIETEKIDLIIPNSDREVEMVSKYRDHIAARVFLPEDEIVQTCQDKHKLYLALSKVGIYMAPSQSLNSMEDIDEAFARLPKTEKYWVRPRRGSGSRGATWVYNAEQAKKWISLWVDLRGYSASEFQISNFLPGRDYAFQSVWKDGKLVVAKMCQRLSYFMGANRLSGMSSTPEIARTVRDDKALETIFRAVHSLTDRPHGNFNMDLKADTNGNMNITEINIGRFCMITTIFDSTGKVNTAEAYVKSAFGEDMAIDDPIDIVEGFMLIRELDTEPLIVHESTLPRPIGGSA